MNAVKPLLIMRPFSPYKGVLILELHHNTRVLELFAPINYITTLKVNLCILSSIIKGGKSPRFLDDRMTYASIPAPR